jgi:ferric-dicitrate binding protein FerR (iron transport regulator)
MRRVGKLAPAFTRLLIAATGLVCLVGPLDSQQDTAAALVVQVGQVSLLKDGAPVALFTGSHVTAQQMVVTGPGSYAKFELSDGSTFEVFENSQVCFHPPNSGITNLLNLIMGRIKVMIDHSRGPNYKDVNTPTAVISVRGTVFTVDVQDTAGTTYVGVDEGVVGVRNVTSFGGSVELHQGESITVRANQPLAVRQIDPHSIMRKIIEAAEQAVYRGVYPHPSGGGPVGNGGGGTSTGQGDKSGNGGKTGTGTSSGGGSAPTTPTAPTAPTPGGGGG